ncbi:hybrid sensor histidine kinase/response regulator transcription factor [Spongiivirga citrea]|uniref:histidine kinase n=1 Tax=Spongiivirga citrea TaxID=1481457 RepID=A0A6M0CVR0_9FLAO|nr:hybrid sensor histidine kinase/response regulator transcription factor [Spongiivirga citrea]NER17850.1 response regulator [Spongiivirga citrea]
MSRTHYFFLLFLLIASHAYGQNKSYKFRSITSNDGLSQSSVIQIHQDRLGRIWLATRDGLNLYDGSSFKIFRNDPTDSLSISNDDILSIKEDSQGKIWIGTYNGLNRYDPVTKTFKRFFHGDKNSNLKDNTIWALEEIGEEIWIGTSKGLFVYNTNNNSFINSTSSQKHLKDSYILSILKTKNNTIWVGTSKGLYKLNSRTDNLLNFDLIANSNVKGTELYIQDLAESNNGTIWIGTKNLGLFKLDRKLQKLELLNEQNEYKDLHTDVRALDFDENNDLWIGTYEGVKILDSKGRLKCISSSTNENLSKVKSIFTDKKGSVWIGKYYGGVSIWDDTNINFTNFDNDFKEGLLSYKVVGSIVADRRSNIYLGTEGGGITILDPSFQNISYINKTNTPKVPSDNIKSLFINNDQLWIGSFNAGVVVYDIKDNKVLTNLLPEKLERILKQSGVYAIKKDYLNNMWFGTFGSGLIHYNIKTNTFRQFTNNSDDPLTLSNNRIRSLLIDSEERIWIGTQKGLNSFKLEDIQDNNVLFNHYFYSNIGASGVDILTIFEDDDHTIWVGTKAKGLYKFNNGLFEKVIIKKGDLQINSIHSILQDNKKNLWLGSNQGIVKYNPKTKNVKIYDQKDGLSSSEFNDNSCLKLNANRLYFGGPSGLSFFDPENIIINDYAPRVILTDLKIMNQSVKVKDETKILKKSISLTDKITLSYNKANFTLAFATPNFINASNNQYDYRMLGLDDQWVNTTNTEASYTIQKPGTYFFEVKGANNDGVWNKNVVRLEIEVLPAPWRSWWAFTIYALLIGLALFFLIRFLKSKAKLKHELELEHIENLRNEQTNKAKLQFFTNISHEFRTPLTLILGPIQQLLEDYKGGNKTYKKLLVIENSATHLLQLINRLMDFRKLENNQLNLRAAEGNIVKFLKEIYLSFTEYAKSGNYTYNFTTTDQEILVYYDRAKLERVFYNLISNAFKYTPKGGTITINVVKNNDHLEVEVQDSGVGISEKYLDKIFDRFFEIPGNDKLHEEYNKGTGIGLSIVRNIVNLHHGTIDVKNQSQRGTVFALKLPLGKLHLSQGEILQDFKISDDISQYESQLENYNLTAANRLDHLIVEKDKQTILIVEDNKPLRSFLKDFLNQDYNVIEAENGKIGLKKALKHVPDLIVSDIIMPEMVGTDLCTEIKQNLKTSHIPVVLLTSRSSLVYKFEGLESGADEYISKPFNLKEFKLRVQNLLQSTSRLKKKFSNENYLKPSDITVSSIDEQLLKKAFQIVENNISNEQFDIPYFCTELGISRTLLFTKIKAWTNFTPNEFIHELRMKRAAQLLEQNKINISQVSYKVGFKNPKYFSKCFQKKFGETPSDYQNKFSENQIL